MDRTGRIEQRERLRLEEPLHDMVVVLRGGPDSGPKIAAHLARTKQRWTLDGAPLVGISVFCALDPDGPASLEGLLDGRLRSYRVVHRATVRRLMSAGMTLLPTSARPHFTVTMSGDEPEIVARFLAVLGRPRENPHYLGRGAPQKGF